MYYFKGAPEGRPFGVSHTDQANCLTLIFNFDFFLFSFSFSILQDKNLGPNQPSNFLTVWINPIMTRAPDTSPVCPITWNRYG